MLYIEPIFNHGSLAFVEKYQIKSIEALFVYHRK